MQKPHAVDTNIRCSKHVRAYARVFDACRRIRLHAYDRQTLAPMLMPADNSTIYKI